MLTLAYERGGLIQEREKLHSSWDVYVPALANVCVGRVESYWTGTGAAVKWRSLDHWYCDWRQGFATREQCAQDLAANCPRAAEQVARARARIEAAAVAT